MTTKTKLVQSIRQTYPEFEYETLQLNGGEGQFNHILIVDESIIFRFPRYAQQIKNLQREVNLLKMLQGKLPIPVPNPIYFSSRARSVGKVFMGYKMLPGRSLWRAYLQTIKEKATRKRLAKQLAAFLVSLHQLPVDLLDGQFEDHDGIEYWADMYRSIREDLMPLMSESSAAQVSRHFEDFLGEAHKHPYVPAIRHGDFGGSNILYDPKTRKISGIIDFGSAGLGDPAVDLAAVSTYGEPFFEMICENYPGVDALLTRARFYHGTFALQEALHGFHNGDQKAFENGMAAYRD